jgi:hypothetical protein
MIHMNQNQPFHEPTRANSYFNSGTGRYHNRPNGNLAPEWDGNPDSVPPGYGVIRIEMGAQAHDNREVSVFVNGFQVTIPRGSARIVSSVHINRLGECWLTEYNQPAFYQPPQGIRRPYFPVSILLQPKGMADLVDPDTGNAVKQEAIEVKRSRKRTSKQNTEQLIGDNEEIEL